jgi:hypothetical protein
MIDDDDEIVQALRTAVPPRGGTAIRRDLWPEMARKISAPRTAPTPGDWALAGVAALWLFIFPRGLTALLYLL